MGMPAQKIEPERFMEERVARLEANVEHIQSDVTELKSDIRRLDKKIDDVKDSLSAFRVETKDALAALNISRMADRVWWLLIAAGLLTVMARGFKWL